jgi:dTDP-D-glucose 4,6-dehydratase
MKIMVTGGAGFIGANFLNGLVPELQEHQFINVDKLKEFVTGRPGHDLRYGIDAARIREECGWEPKKTIGPSFARRSNGTCRTRIGCGTC